MFMPTTVFKMPSNKPPLCLRIPRPHPCVRFYFLKCLSFIFIKPQLSFLYIQTTHLGFVWAEAPKRLREFLRLLRVAVWSCASALWLLTIPAMGSLSLWTCLFLILQWYAKMYVWPLCLITLFCTRFAWFINAAVCVGIYYWVKSFCCMNDHVLLVV